MKDAAIKIEKCRLRGTVKAPPSKSESHRLLIAAGLADGTSTVRGVGGSEDINATLDCLSALGAEYSRSGDVITVKGADPKKRGSAVFPCRESGSTLRFFIPIALLSGNDADFTGSERLFQRPLSVYSEICLGQGLPFGVTESGITVAGPIEGGYFRVPGDISSQFVSGLMFALPLTDGYSVIELQPPVASKPYIEMTSEALSAFGVTAELNSDMKVIIPGGQRYSPCDVTVEGDWSNAAFFLALAALGNDIEVGGLEYETLQGDAVIRRLLCRLVRGKPTIDITDCPDLAPVLMATAAALNGVTLTGTDRLKIKESDRGQAMADELAKFGVPVTVGDDFITVAAPKILKKPDVPINGHNDHRIVMANAVLLTVTGGEIVGADAVNKSYPEFFDDLAALRAE